MHYSFQKKHAKIWASEVSATHSFFKLLACWWEIIMHVTQTDFTVKYSKSHTSWCALRLLQPPHPPRPASRQWPPKHVISCGTSLLYPRANTHRYHRWVGKLWRDRFQLGFPQSGFPHLDSLFYYLFNWVSASMGIDTRTVFLGDHYPPQKKTEIWSPNVPLNSMVYGRYNYRITG